MTYKTKAAMLITVVLALCSGCETSTAIENLSVTSKECEWAAPMYYDWRTTDRELEVQLELHNANYDSECLGITYED